MSSHACGISERERSGSASSIGARPRRPPEYRRRRYADTGWDRVGGSYAIAASIAPAPVRSRAQRKKISVDEDYSNRDGYDPRFVSGVTFPLPTPVGKLAKQLAPLRAGEQNAEAGELKYEHFGIKMNKAKKMAPFTATNIDGKSFLNVDRSTGRSPMAPKEKRGTATPASARASSSTRPSILVGPISSTGAI